VPSARGISYKAGKKIPRDLNDNQKKNVIRFEEKPHPEPYGNLNGATPPPPREFVSSATHTN